MSDPIFKLPDQVAHVAQVETVLDVATGRGAVLLPAAWQVGPAGQVIGIDIAQGMVDETAAAVRVLGLANAQVRRIDAEELDFPEATFDAVLCGFGVFFFPNLRATLAQFLHVLKPGGRPAVSTWGRDDERWAWLGDLRQKYMPALLAGAAPRRPSTSPKRCRPPCVRAG